MVNGEAIYVPVIVRQHLRTYVMRVVFMATSSRLRKSCGRPGQLSPRVNITHYVTPQQPENARKCPPDTRGMAFEKLILFSSRHHESSFDA